MKCLSAIFAALLTCSTILAGARSATAQTIFPLQQDIPLPGAVFAVTTTRDGKYVFASMVKLMDGQKGGVAVLRQHRTFASPVRTLDTGGSVFGLTMTRDGKYLVAAVQPIGNATSPGGVQFIDVRKLIAGQPGALVGTVATAASAIEIGISNDGNFVFVANEDDDTLSVIDLKAAIASGGSQSSIVGTIPVEHLPVGLAFSGDGRLLYVTNEEANSSDPNYDPTACNIFDGINNPPQHHKGPKGTLSIIDVQMAETNPASVVPGSVYAGCSPTRVVLSDDSKLAWVSARDDDTILTFNTADLLANPSNALLATTPVGVAPDGAQFFSNHRFIAIANTNRFQTGQAGTVSILDYKMALRGAGSLAVLGTFAAGAFPRQWGISPNGKRLYLTEFGSGVLAIFPVPVLVKQLR